MRDPSSRSSQALIDRLAGQLQRWELSQPAILFLEVTQPLGFVASQGLLLCEPVLSFFGELPVADYAELLSDRANVKRLIVRLEQGEQARTGEEKA